MLMGRSPNSFMQQKSAIPSSYVLKNIRGNFLLFITSWGL